MARTQAKKTLTGQNKTPSRRKGRQSLVKLLRTIGRGSPKAMKKCVENGLKTLNLIERELLVTYCVLTKMGMLVKIKEVGGAYEVIADHVPILPKKYPR